MKQFLFYVCFFFSLIASAQDGGAGLKDKADKAYSKEQYELASKLYLELTSKGENADVYYNLGNCYYRMDNIARAILWYERALLLNPGDSDVRFNLQLARTKTVDKIVPEEEIFFARWYHSMLNTMSVSAWVWTGIVLFILMLTGLLFYFFGGQMMLRKCGFFCATILFVLVILCNVFALQQRSRKNHRDGAIVMQNAVEVKSTPSTSGTALFILNAGTSMRLLDTTMKDWYKIRLSDGKEGWIPTNMIEVI